MEKSRIVTVTGTKGKTTVTTILAQVLRELTRKDTLLVTTTGHFVNGERRSTLESSQALWGLVPSVAPGRYLYETEHFAEPGVAVLEASLGSSSTNGLAYSWHDVGVFLNVFKDHIGSSERLKSQADIVNAKRFSFTRVRDGGWAVYNADDAFVCTALPDIPAAVKRISFGLSDAANAASNHVFINDGTVYLKTLTETKPLLSVAEVVWTFNGQFKPSCYNLMAVVAATIAYHDGVVPEGLAAACYASRFDRYGGRLTLLKNDAGVTILADYAHEEESMRSVGHLAKTLTTEGGRVIGVVRLAYDRTDEHIDETAQGIATAFDHFIVYDKIDGKLRQPKVLQSKRFVQEVGKVSTRFAAALQASGATVDRILSEDDAIKHAVATAQPGDVVVHIVNDDIARSIDWLVEYFDARFV